LFLAISPAQNRLNYPLSSQNSGHVTLGLALRKLNVSGTFMQTAAHPDDETNSLYAMFTYGMGLRSIDVQTTRGDGGQNEIGPELFRNMAVLRTSELLSAHRIDGAEQYFTRAIDYGYSFDPEEVIGKWGRKDIVGDYVRLWRTLRPDVIVTMNIQGGGGDRAHEATTVLVRESFRAAGDPSMYPEQIAQGLHAWQPKKIYFAGGGGGARGGRGQGAPATPLTPVNTAAYDPLLGRTYADIGNDARTAHKCQGIGGVGGGGGGAGGRGGPGGGAPPAPAADAAAGRGAPAPDAAAGGRGAAPAAGRGAPAGGGGRGGYSLVDTTIAGEMQKQETSVLDGIDTSLTGIAQYAGANAPRALTDGLAAILKDAQAAQKAFAEGNDAGTAAPAEAGLTAIRALRAQVGSMGLDDAARYEIDFRLNLKERDYQDAVIAAHDITFDATSDDGLVIAGQPVQLRLQATNHGAADISVSAVDIAGFDGGTCAAGSAKKDAVFACTTQVHVPKDAKLTSPYFDDNYWKHPENQAIQIFDPSVPFGAPFAPTPFRVTFHVKAGSVDVTKELGVEYRYMKDIYFGDKRMELNVVPAFSVRLSPNLAVIPAPTASAAKPIEREVDVTVTNGGKGAAKTTVTLDPPAGWKVTPANAQIAFTHEDEALSARFKVLVPVQAKIGNYTLHATVTSAETGDQKFSNGYLEIEYPHIQRRQVIEPAEIAMKVVDVKTVPRVDVGYIVGVGDSVPPAIEQLGAKLSYIERDELAWGDLSKHDVIITGVRAYERRDDLRAYNRRLLDYVDHGGTVIVQYNKTEFNREEYGPYSAKVSSNRVTDETAPVKVLAPTDPIFNFPNKIGAATWAGWVQERGLYFIGDKDKRYIDLISMTDPFKDNPGEKLGSMVECKYGKGKWIYLGLGLWRQLPAGTVGAYQLLANLIALPKAPAVPVPAVKTVGN
jgi:LmbE family N-acetylglucosaminyl deacetylase